MGETPLLWASGARKEVMDLLQRLWTSGGPELRDRLANAIVAGPPQELLAHIEAGERETSRDRRIFDRLVIIERVGTPPLNSILQVEAARLHEIHPAWRASDGERAHFSSWMEMSSGPEARYYVDDLKALSDDALVDVLINDQEMREGLLDAWRQLGNAEPARAITLLERLVRRQEAMGTDLWEYGLWGVRDAAKQPDLRTRIISLLETLPQELLEHADISSAVSDVLQTATASPPSLTNDEAFWRVFDRTAQAIELDSRNADARDERDWISFSINQSMGKMATAFFSAMFTRELKVGARLPNDLRPKLDTLLAPGTALHRPARVIAASRLSYLFAVDPDWTQATLIPSFDWATNEVEALAVWQGYAWQPRIDRKLWSALKPYFLLTFSSKRLERLGDWGRNLAQMLMLVGIEFGLDELPRDDARNAIRAMPDEMRREAVSWIVSFLEQTEEEDHSHHEGEAPRSSARQADTLWTQKVAPWLDRVWPPDPALRSPSTAEQFALVTIATDARFPDAVTALAPYMVPANAYYVIQQLAKSTHPEHHAAATLTLIEAITDPNAQRFGNHLSRVLERVRIADPGVVQTAIFRTWENRMRVRQ